MQIFKINIGKWLCQSVWYNSIMYWTNLAV